MPDGFSTTVMERLWKLIVAIKVAVPKKQLSGHLKCSERTVVSDIQCLKKMGINITYSRKKGIYYIDFPHEQKLNITLKDRELFFTYYLLLKAKKCSKLLHELNIADGSQIEPVHNCMPETRIDIPIGFELQEKYETIQHAILEKTKIIIFYRKTDGKEDLRLIHPYKLIHTPISWYCVAWCEESLGFRNFKLVRISHLKMTNDKFSKKPFNIIEHLGDSWWLQYSPENLKTPYNIMIKFTGEASKSIKEYNLHISQKIVEEGDEYTIVQWKMSYLYEFGTWLMQWIGSIQILEPQELKDIIHRKIKAYLSLDN